MKASFQTAWPVYLFQTQRLFFASFAPRVSSTLQLSVFSNSKVEACSLPLIVFLSTTFPNSELPYLFSSSLSHDV